MPLEMRDRKAADAAVVELLFVLLPLIVLLIVLLHKSAPYQVIFESPEWSFAAAVFFGQGAVKFVHGVAGHPTRHVSGERIALIITLVIVLGLVPSLTTLGLILSMRQAGFVLIRLQMIMFVASTITFLVLAFLGRRLSLEQGD